MKISSTIIKTPLHAKDKLFIYLRYHFLFFGWVGKKSNALIISISANLHLLSIRLYLISKLHKSDFQKLWAVPGPKKFSVLINIAYGARNDSEP